MQVAPARPETEWPVTLQSNSTQLQNTSCMGGQAQYKGAVLLGFQSRSRVTGGSGLKTDAMARLRTQIAQQHAEIQHLPGKAGVTADLGYLQACHISIRVRDSAAAWYVAELVLGA